MYDTTRSHLSSVLTFAVVLLNSITLSAAAERDIEISLTASPAEELKLSPFQLAMVSDLLIQIAMHRCPLVSRPGVRSMKQYIFTTIAKAPESRAAHPQFYSNYQNLVQCLSYLEDHFPKKSRSPIYEAVSDKVTGRRKRETTDSVEEVNDLIPQQKESLSDNTKSAEGPKLQPFELLFTVLQRLTESSCPARFGPDSQFISRSVREILEWIQNHNLMKDASQKYFEKMGILTQFRDCSEILQTNLSKSPSNKQ